MYEKHQITLSTAGCLLSVIGRIGRMTLHVALGEYQ